MIFGLRGLKSAPEKHPNFLVLNLLKKFRKFLLLNAWKNNFEIFFGKFEKIKKIVYWSKKKGLRLLRGWESE